MNFFIDFEATQFTQEIISIGCVSETGHSFYSEVNCSGKITPFITNLTGLTPEQISNAPSADSVFVDFAAWLMRVSPREEIPKFYVFGNGDKTFIQSTLKRVINSIANQVLCVILGNLVDYSEEIRKQFKLNRQLSLVRILELYKNIPIRQRHNALEDAFFLQEVFEFISQDSKPLIEACGQVQKRNKPIPAKTIDRAFGTIVCKKKGEDELRFAGMPEAVDWFIETQLPKTANVHKNNIAKNIHKAIQNKTKYNSYKWREVR